MLTYICVTLTEFQARHDAFIQKIFRIIRHAVNILILKIRNYFQQILEWKRIFYLKLPFQYSFGIFILNSRKIKVLKDTFDCNIKEVRSISGDTLKDYFQEENFITFCKCLPYEYYPHFDISRNQLHSTH